MRQTGFLPVGWETMRSNDGGKTIGETLAGLFYDLEKSSDTPDLDSQVLLARILDMPRSRVLAHPEISLTKSQSTKLKTMVARLQEGDPLPYILGHWEFFSLEFDVTPDVLIPRPETELMVEIALNWLRQRPECRRAADIGTGSGCIGITLAVNIPDLHVSATDISPKVIPVARRNAEKNHVEKRMDFVCCDLFPAGSYYDLIVANPPYIPTQVLRKLPIYGHEPTLALDGGPDGLTLIRRLITSLPNHLVAGGLLLMEVEASEGPAGLDLAFNAFSEARIHLHRDLAGHDRILEVQL
jgi:release factor glutamine methyltransferase